MTTKNSRKSNKEQELDVVINNGNAYFASQSVGIPPLIIMIDGFQLTFFGKNQKDSYLQPLQVLEWYEQEIRDRPEDGRLKPNLDVIASWVTANRGRYGNIPAREAIANHERNNL